jgi:hypothetical protein
MDFKEWIYFPIHAIVMEKGQPNYREGQTLSSIGCLITEVNQVVSRATCITVVLHGVFI